MNITTIDGYDIKNWFKFGFHEVDLNKKHLNDINVFPVPDGDTGTNLTITLKAMAERPESTASFGSMIEQISEYGLSHARGNSGIIFASYVNGLAEEGKVYERVTLSEFAQVANDAVAYIYKAIEKPVEGTMVTIIRDWATFLYANHHKFDFFEELFFEAYKIAKISLAKTTERLEVLKKNKVVDAGAEGFVRFLKGINMFFNSQSNQEEEPVEVGPVIEKDREDYNGYRFCTEILVRHATKDLTDLRKKLEDMGDSLILSAHHDQLRVHVHTDQPQNVMSIMKREGEVLEQKVDDMRLQDRVLHQKISRIGLLTDSIADLPEDLKLSHQIHSLPLTVVIDEVNYLDKRTIDLKTLFEEIPKAEAYPTSSQPEPFRVRDMLEYMCEQYESVIVISVAEKLSGTYRVIKSEADRLAAAGKKITVIDSKLNSGAQGLMVKKAAELIVGGYSHEKVVEAIQLLIPKTKIYVCLDTIENAIRSGRVPNTVGRLGIAIGARPIMTLDQDGKGAAFGVGFSKKGMTKKINTLVRKIHKAKGIQAYSIVHAQNPEMAEEYSKYFTELIGRKPEFITEISAITAIHSGLGCVAISLVEK